MIFRPLLGDALSLSHPLCLAASEADTIVNMVDQATGDGGDTVSIQAFASFGAGQYRYQEWE